MKLLSFNANGIRSAARKGFFAWLARQSPDIACIQEVRASLEQLKDSIFHPPDYYRYYFPAQRKGYSGTALYSRLRPRALWQGMGFPLVDAEGRYQRAVYGGLSIICFYMPSGSSGPGSQARKFVCMERMLRHLTWLRLQGVECIICADWNICHRKIDLKNWRANQFSSGFLPEERDWLDRLFALGYVDSFRLVNADPEQYTWWSNRGRARQNNVGWRLDYQLISPGLRERVVSASIHPEPFFSDHAPLIMEYDLDLRDFLPGD